MIEGEAAVLTEQLKRALALVDALAKRVDLIEKGMRTLHQNSQRQHQAIRASKSSATD